jgi:hypothetical protein
VSLGASGERTLHLRTFGAQRIEHLSALWQRSASYPPLASPQIPAILISAEGGLDATHDVFARDRRADDAGRAT